MNATWTAKDEVRAILGVKPPRQSDDFRVPDRLIDDALQAMRARRRRPREQRGVTLDQYEHLNDRLSDSETKCARAVRNRRSMASIARCLRQEALYFKALAAVLACTTLAGCGPWLVGLWR